MKTILAGHEKKLFNDILEVRTNNKGYQLLKTAEECSELSQMLIKLTNLHKDRELIRGNFDIKDLAQHRNTLLSEIDEKVHETLENIIREYVDVDIEMQMLRMQILKSYISEYDFNKITNDAYDAKMNKIQLNLSILKGEDNEDIF